MKKIIALFMALTMILGMNLSVFATSPSQQATTGSISIVNPMDGMEYQIYQMFSLESSDGTAYSYTVLPEWANFVLYDTVAKTMLEIYDTDHVRIKNGAAEGQPYEALELTDSNKADLAVAAIKYAEMNGIEETATLPSEVNGNKQYTVEGLDLGYYAMSSGAGAICSLSTANPTAVLYEKNEQPTVDKKVLEDVNNNGAIDDGDVWRSVNDDEAGDTIFYKTTIAAKKGAHGYVLHDRMGDGLTLNKNSIEITVGASTLTGYLVNEEEGRPELESYETYDYYVLYGIESSENSTEVCDFEVHFTESYLKTLDGDVDIVVFYNAELNEHALIYEEGNINATKLQYGDDNFTEIIRTYTYTYMFDVIKTDDQNKIIQNAVFEVYRAVAEGTEGAKELKLQNGTTVYAEANPVKLISKGNETYMVTYDTDSRGVTSFKAGDVTIKGLDVGTYYMVETAPPAGYNQLDYAIKIEFVRNDSTLKSHNNMGETLDGYYVANSGGYQVINKTGTLLPETGGTGRTVLYVAGSILTVAAVVVLVTKKRMRNEK